MVNVRESTTILLAVVVALVASLLLYYYASEMRLLRGCAWREQREGKRHLYMTKLGPASSVSQRALETSR